VLAQIQVEATGSGVGVFLTLLEQFDLTEVLVTADALHANRGHADYLHERGGHYLMTVKANQPTLLRRLRALPWAQIGASARERARGHGRAETRTISVVSLHLCPDQGGDWFPHAAQAIKLLRRRRPLSPGGKWKTVTVYASRGAVRLLVTRLGDGRRDRGPRRRTPPGRHPRPDRRARSSGRSCPGPAAMGRRDAGGRIARRRCQRTSAPTSSATTGASARPPITHAEPTRPCRR
jgi:hypothetical protein